MSHNDNDCAPRTVSTREAAEMLGVGTSTINRMIHEGHLRASRKSMAPRSPFQVYVDSIKELQKKLMVN